MIEFDLNSLKKIVNDMSKNIKHIEQGKKSYFNQLINKLRLQQTLEAHIDDLVYGNSVEDIYSGKSSVNEGSRKWYQRTGDLKSSVSLDKQKNSLFLYTSKKYLESRPQATQKSQETGYGQQAHSILKNYAWTVEKGHQYKNEVGKDWWMPERPFMEKTYEDVKSKMSGTYHPERILDKFIKEWSKR